MRLKRLEGNAREVLVLGTVDHLDQPTGETPDVVEILLAREQTLEA